MNCLSHKRENPSSILQSPQRKLDVVAHTIISLWDGRDKQIPGDCWPVSLAYLVSARVVSPCLKKARRIGLEEHHPRLTSGFYISTQLYA